MSTVTELVDQICRHTGIDSTTGTADRTEALRALNRAHRRVLIEAHSNRLSTTATIDEDASSETLSGISVIHRAYRNEDGVELDSVTLGEIQRRLVDEPTEATAYYFDPLTQVLRIDAVAGSEGIVVLLDYSGRPSTLGEGGAESTILVDPMFHEDLLGEMGACYVLEGYEGQEERAAYYRGRNTETMQLYKEHVAFRSRSDRVPSDHGGRWLTPDVSSSR